MSYLDKIVWIDDNEERRVMADKVGAKFVLLGKDDTDIDKRLDKFLSGEKPRLVILDHILDTPQSKISQIYKRGSSIAEAAKVNWPSCPVVGITNADLNRVNERTRDAYDEFFDSARFRDYIEQIPVLISGFQAMNERIPLDADKVLGLLEAPNIEKDRMTAAMPELVKQPEDDSSLPSVIYKWVQHLFERAGFLYDELWTATFLGLTTEGFKKVENKFRDAHYSGIFSRTDNQRWWSIELAGILYSFAKSVPGGSTWHAIRNVQGLEAGDFSKCYECEKEFPETVAFEDAESQNRFPMHLECTVLHPRYKRELYFEDVRMMDGE